MNVFNEFSKIYIEQLEIRRIIEEFNRQLSILRNEIGGLMSLLLDARSELREVNERLDKLENTNTEISLGTYDTNIGY